VVGGGGGGMAVNIKEEDWSNMETMNYAINHYRLNDSIVHGLF